MSWALLWQARRWIGVGLLALAAGMLAWAWGDRGRDLDAARTALALAEENARQNARAVDAVTRTAARNLDAVTRAAAAERARLLSSLTIQRRIDDAPLTHGCADSPAIGAVLDGLRGRTAPAPGSTGPAGHPGRPADLPAGTDTPTPRRQ